ncbi:DUF2069 domain-containing protein [Simiduia sp. 21SJ11W-1]|uniref:DUF2069 domain-containing protein n=1 Tax=Simiduia sp. 21SJ11W-1 TaxID=2909669 RepID=UPI0020A1300A|nr:DUF2069 domain-containing protein [Simiduia sp. 21SJ11W-1]UTA46699.1 DUF2069 domain-containing protein [Simiduia sp. 21SJ11W-1]
MNPPTNVNQKALWGQRLSAGAMALLVLNALAQQFAPEARLSTLIIQLVPLLIFVPGMLAKHYRTYSWLCFVVLFYFIVGVTNVMSPLADVYGWVTLLASVVLFNAAMMTSRWLQYAGKALTQE